MATVALPPVANQMSALLTTSAGFDDNRPRKPRRFHWGADLSYGGPQDCSKNLPIAHVVPVGVKSTDIECFMTPKAFQSDVGSLMRLTHNKKRRVPRDPTQAIFPQNEPTRTNNQDSFVLSQATRESLDRCNKTLYITPWASKTLPDFTPEIRRTARMERKKDKLLQQRQEIIRESNNDCDAFRYTTIYRNSYTKNSLAADQSKVYLPPLQRKISYAKSTDEEQDEPEEELCQEDIGAWRVPEDHGQDSGDDQRLADAQRMPFCESLINIRRRLRSEGWSVPAIYTRQHPSYAEDFEDYIAGRDLGHSHYSRLQTSDVCEGPSPVRQSNQNLIRCSSANLYTNTATNSECQSSPKLHQRVKIHCPNVAQTRIKYSPRLGKEKDSEFKREAGLRPVRRVTFDPNSPEVHSVESYAAPLRRSYFSLRQTTPVREGKVDGEEERKEEENIDDEWGTDEMLEAGYRRRTLLPRLQVRDFKTLYHSKHHLVHLEQVPDLRDFRTYTKRVYFDGINSSVYRG